VQRWTSLKYGDYIADDREKRADAFIEKIVSPERRARRGHELWLIGDQEGELELLQQPGV
jgi:hypothetical protein